MQAALDAVEALKAAQHPPLRPPMRQPRGRNPPRPRPRPCRHAGQPRHARRRRVHGWSKEGVPEAEERAGPSFGTPQVSRPPPIHRGVDGRVPRRRRRNRKAPSLGVVRGTRALHALRSRRGVGARRSRPSHARSTTSEHHRHTRASHGRSGAAVLPPRAGAELGARAGGVMGNVWGGWEAKG